MAVPLLAVGLLLSYMATPGLDRADVHVPQPGRGDRRHLRRGLPPLQRRPRQPDRRLLLVGLGADLRTDRHLLGGGHPPVVPARTCRSSSWPPSIVLGLHGGQPVRPALGRPGGQADRPDRLRPRPVLGPHPGRHRARGLAPGPRLPPGVALRRHLRPPDERHGRPLPDRVRRPRLRGGGLPHRGDEGTRPATSPAAMWFSGGMASVFFVLIPVVWLGVFGSGPLEGNLAAVLGPTFAPVLRRAWPRPRAVGFVCLQHVLRDPPAAVGGVAHPLPAVRGRPAAAHHRLPQPPHRRPRRRPS